MNKSTIIYIFIALILGVAVYFILRKDRSGTIPEGLRDFAISDTQNVTKIVLSDRYNTTTILERQPDGNWLINKKYKAFKDRVELLLECLKRIQVRTPVPAEARDKFIKDMAATGVKIELYKNHESSPAKAYTVGGNTADELGTVMLLKGSPEPFVMHIPGFNGYLSVRYFTAVQDWRSRVALEFNPLDLTSLEIEYPAYPKRSFILRMDEKNVSIENPESHQKAKPKMDKVKAAVIGFSHLDFEDFISPKFINIDSTISSEPFAIIKPKTKHGNQPELRLYRKRASGQTKFIEDKIWDGDKFFGALSSSPKELFSIQRFVLDKIPMKWEEME
ncbi:MAG: hypothetical protein NTX03_13320 [Bacteroidetes bacterium]|nr:hypothetical protein [Bacteroidota bacterium]